MVTISLPFSDRCSHGVSWQEDFRLKSSVGESQDLMGPINSEPKVVMRGTIPSSINYKYFLLAETLPSFLEFLSLLKLFGRKASSKVWIT